MSIRTKSSLKGLRDIRTHSGNVDRTDIPYMAYMKISCLEMEKARRDQERFSAHERIKSIDDRVKQIEAEKTHILARLGDTPSRLPCRSAGSLRDTRFQDGGESRKGFKIRY